MIGIAESNHTVSCKDTHPARDYKKGKRIETIALLIGNYLQTVSREARTVRPPWALELAQRIEKRGHTQYAHPVELAHRRQSLLLLTAGVLYDFGVDEEDYLLRYVRQMVSRALQFAECAA